MEGALDFIHEVEAVVQVKIQFGNAAQLLADFGTQRLSHAPPFGFDLLQRLRLFFLQISHFLLQRLDLLQILRLVFLQFSNFLVQRLDLL